MSVVIRESHSNNSQPLFLSVNGGTSTGEIFAPGFDLTLNNGTPIGSRIAADGLGVNGTMYLQGSQFKFGQLGTGNVNTSLQVSPFPTKADVLTVGGNLYVADTIFGIGPAPTSTTLASASLPVAPGSPATFTVSSTLFPLVAGAEYDVQCNGYWAVAAAAPQPGDKAQIRLAVGSAISPGFYNFTYDDDQYPHFTEDPWGNGQIRPFKIRARMISNGIPSLILQASITGTGAYSVDADITTLDIVRVK